MSQSESDVTSAGFDDTELTLRLPRGDSLSSPPTIGQKGCAKRGFIKALDPDCSENVLPRVKKRRDVSDPPAIKARVVGWPPVRWYRKKAIESRKYVKVAVDGAPYLRKVDLCLYGCYRHLLAVLEDMFSCFTIHGGLGDDREKWKLVDGVKGVEYVPTYEDKDGDLMLVGDVPWKMFIESCKRIRLMKSAEAMGLGASTKSNMI